MTLYDKDNKYNEKFESIVREKLMKKINGINPKLDLSEFDVKIENKSGNKIRKIIIKKCMNIATHCQISIKCSKEVAELLYDVGIGQSTGVGFGRNGHTEVVKILLEDERVRKKLTPEEIENIKK